MCQRVKELLWSKHLTGSLAECHRKKYFLHSHVSQDIVNVYKLYQLKLSHRVGWMCVPPTGWLRWSQGSDPNQSRDCQVEKNIMASDLQALSKRRLYWHAEWSLDTHSCMCRTHTAHVLQKSTFSTHYWHTRTFESNAHTHLTRTCRACMQALSWYTHTCAHMHGVTFSPFGARTQLWTRSHTHTRLCTLSFKHTFPPEHWMQHSLPQTHCQIDLLPWNAG